MDQDFDVVEEVQGEIVEITQGGAGRVQATTVNVTQGGIQTATTENLTISQGGVAMVETTDASITMGGVGILAADNVQLSNSAAAITVADTVKADEKSTIGVLFAGTIEGNPNIAVDGRKTIAAVAAFAGVLMVLRKALGGRR